MARVVTAHFRLEPNGVSHRNRKSRGRAAKAVNSLRAAGKFSVVQDAVGGSAMGTGQLVVAGLVMLAAVMWAYWSTLAEMVHAWSRQPDYSHGYLVLPIALFFLWSRRSTLPLEQLRPSVWGVLLER